MTHPHADIAIATSLLRLSHNRLSHFYEFKSDFPHAPLLNVDSINDFTCHLQLSYPIGQVRRDPYGKNQHFLKCKSTFSSLRPSLLPTSRLFPFLDASSHLYNRLCPSVGRLVSRSVGNAFIKNIKIKHFCIRKVVLTQ